MLLDDTIAAVATPLGEGIAVIRLSGPQALAITDRCFVPLGKSASLKPSAAPTHTIRTGESNGGAT